jgi:ABC-2 type transport system ATP-binding protein
MSILLTNRLTRRFGKFTAVDNFNIAVDRGEIFGLLGRNGAGKTTVMKMLTTLLPPTSGSAVVAGFDIVSASVNVRRSMGYVPQLLSADGDLTGFENLLLFARLFDLPRSEQRPRVLEALRFMGLTNVAHQQAKTYSGGMIRRLEIAQSTLHRPQVLFLDEPTVGLDPLARATVWDYLLRLNREHHTTILLTTHYMEEADRLCHRVALMDQGRIVTIGEPDQLKLALGAEATMEDVFVQHAGDGPESTLSYREIHRTRETAKRLG